MEVAYLLINCRQGKLKIVSSALKKHEEVDEVHELYGRFDIIAKVICENRSEMKGYIQNKLQITEGIKASETLIVNDLAEDE